MATIGTTRLNFIIPASQSPKDLLIADYSQWFSLENRPALIHITVPGSSSEISYTFTKHAINSFNSNTLYTNCSTCDFSDLSDGIYKIRLESTAPFELTKYYLKTDLTELEMGEMLTQGGFIYNNVAEGLISTHNKISYYLETAKYLCKTGDINEAQRYFQEAQNIIGNNCKSCH